MKIGYLMQAGVPDVRVTPRSGPAAHVVHVYEELARLGHQLRLLAVLDGRLWTSDDLETFRPVTVPSVDRGPYRLMERGVRRTQKELRLPYINFFNSVRFAAACRQELADCDLLYERMGWMGCGGALAAARTGQPLVLEVNGDHLAEYEMLGIAPHGVQRAASVRFMRWAAQQATLVVASGDGWRRRFLERWRVDARRVVVVENGSELVELLDRDQLRAFQPAANADPSLRLVYVGSFEPWHGIDVLLHALALAVVEHPLIRLDLIGDGSALPDIKRIITEHKLAPNVTLHGFLSVKELAPLLAARDIGLAPYCGRVEYSGLKLLDYKAAGLATIASGAGNEPAVLRHGQTGWIVPPCDVEQLAAAILALAKDPQLCQCIGRAARLEAEAQHSWRHTAQELERLFEGVLAHAR